MHSQKFNVSMVRTILIYLLFGWLIILRLLPISVLRGANCITPITGVNLTCTDNSLVEIDLWGILILLILWELTAKKEWKGYFSAWKKLWVLLPFLALALISTSWSAAPMVTLERCVILVFSSLAAVFVLFNKDLHSSLNLLGIYFGVLIVFCYLLVFLLPSMGTMDFKPYYGAWRGIFWHRNYLGSFMTLAAVVYLFNLLFPSKRQFHLAVLNGIGFIASVGLVFGSHSGAGILTLALLIGISFLIFVWTKIRVYLKNWHYIALVIVSLVSLVLVFTNLDFIFGLVGRNTSLTGRIPLWKLIYEEFISKRLFFGFGYGAFWTFEPVRVGLQNQLSWGYPVLIGDNGLMDIQIHLGLAGSLLMLLIIGYALFSTGNFAGKNKTGLSFFPLIGIIFIVMSNVSLSMLIELEFLNWSLLIMFIMLSLGIQKAVPAHQIEKPL